MRERWPLEGDVLETRQIDHAGLDAKELIWHCHENANKWIVDDGVFDVKTMDELVAEANTDRLEREGGRRSFIVDFHSDTESEDDEEDIDLAEPADPEVAPAAVSARGVGSVGNSVGVSSSSGLLDASPVSVVFRRLRVDASLMRAYIEVTIIIFIIIIIFIVNVLLQEQAHRGC